MTTHLPSSKFQLKLQLGSFAVTAAGEFSLERNRVPKSIDLSRAAGRQAVISLTGHYL